MHAALFNRMTLVVSLSPYQSAVLVGSGKGRVDPSRSDNSFMRVATSDGEVPVIAGSSIKGALREAAERIYQREGRRVCGVFGNNSCSDQLTAIDSDQRAEAACEICRLFGANGLKGRISFGDFLGPNVRLERRQMVAIDRRTQSPQGLLFDAEVAVGGHFDGRIILENFTIREARLLAELVRRMEAGLIAIGAGQSKGWGWLYPEIEEATIMQAPGPESYELWGAEAWMDPHNGRVKMAWDDAERTETFLGSRTMLDGLGILAVFKTLAALKEVPVQ